MNLSSFLILDSVIAIQHKADECEEVISMRSREEILNESVKLKGLSSKMFDKFKTASVVNPQLQIEVLLDIRDLLIELTKKSE